MRRAVFLDRDGVINKKYPEGQYVTRWEEMDIFPDVVPAITRLNRAGFRVIVVSNQRCVAKGLITTSELDQMHQRMCDVLADAGATIDRVYYCPHEVRPPCDCRKPAPGMLFDAARAHDIDLPSSWIIGDSEIDVEAGKSAGCKTARLLNAGQTVNSNADVVAPSLLEVVDQVLKGAETQSQARTNGMAQDRSPLL
jgi:D-glycero-D-manno-heptose 1,7-bisphosphate phosphatase